ncbi:MAG TPA: hypothetical protein VIO14_12505 [Dehalococcoidia bacterium]
MTDEERRQHAARLQAAAEPLLAANELFEADAAGPVREGRQTYLVRLAVRVAEGPGWVRVTGEVPPEPVEEAEPGLVAASILPQLREAAVQEMVRRFG